MAIFDEFKKGDRLSAEWVNEITKEVMRVMKISGSGDISVNRNGAGIHISSQAKKFDNTFKFLNSSGETIPAYSIMSIVGGVANEQILIANKPNTSYQRLLAINGASDIANNTYGRASFGPAKCKYDTSSTPGTGVWLGGGEYWGAKPGQWTLSKNYPGARILSLLDSTNKICLAETEPDTALVGKSGGFISAKSGNSPGGGTMIVHGLISGSFLQLGSTTMTLTVYNNTTGTVVTDRDIQAKFAGGKFWLDVVQC